MGGFGGTNRLRAWVALSMSRRIRSPNRLAEDMPPPGITGCTPTFLVYEVVMPPAERNQIVEVGGAAFGPGLAVMDLEEGGSPTFGEPAVMVPSDDLSPQPAGDLA